MARLIAEQPLLEIRDLKKNYYGTAALKGVSLKIRKGMILGLLGPNGSGKSTLLKAVAGLVRPSSGSIMINGVKPSFQTKADVAYLPEIDHLYAWMTVREIMGFVAAFYPDWEMERAMESLRQLNLNPGQKVGSLSKGQRAQLKLLLALARRVPLILLDEPLSGIDPPSRANIIQMLITGYRDGEQTIICSTHQVGEMEGIFDEVLFLRDGEVALWDSAEKLRQEHGCSIQDLWGRVYH